MKDSRVRDLRPIAWTIRLALFHLLVIMGILAVFYATDRKPLAMQLIRTVNPLSSVLPWMTQNMRPNRLNVRLYDFLVVLTMVIQGCVLGSIIDLIRWLGRRKPTRDSSNAR